MRQASIRMPGEVCLRAHCGYRLQFTTDTFGRTIARCDWCERRRRGICRDCPSRVGGTIGKALRCARCKREARRAAARRYDNGHREHRARRDHERSAASRARHNAKRRQWRKAHPDQVKAQKRRASLRQSLRRLQYWRHYNARHREGRRAAELRRYYRLHPVRPSCRCTDCGARVSWTPGHGRPPRRCDACCAPGELRRRLRKRGKAA